MNLPIQWARAAEKQFDKQQAKTRKIILRHVETWLKTGHGDVVPFEGRDDYLRMAVGGFRLVFTVLEDGALYVVSFGPRGDVYK